MSEFGKDLDLNEEFDFDAEETEEKDVFGDDEEDDEKEEGFLEAEIVEDEPEPEPEPEPKKTEKKEAPKKAEKKEEPKKTETGIAQVETGKELGISEKATNSLENTKGVVVGEIGMKVARVPIERYKATTQKIDRISIITKKVIAVKTHYFDGVGSVLCFERRCCEIGGMPNVRYLFPIVVYSTDNEGNIVGKKLDLKILSAGEDLYKSIITVNASCKGVGGIDQVDLFVTCTDEKYQRISLNQAGMAAWRKSKMATKFVIEKWNKDSEFAYMAVARKVDEEALMKLLGMEGTEGPQVFDDSNTDLNSFFDDN